jgi:hypothetical protein
MKHSALTEQIKRSVIDVILASPLNVQSIPDDIERQIYEEIFNIIDTTMNAQSCFSFCHKKSS